MAKRRECFSVFNFEQFTDLFDKLTKCSWPIFGCATIFLVYGLRHSPRELYLCGPNKNSTESRLNRRRLFGLEIAGFRKGLSRTVSVVGSGN